MATHSSVLAWRIPGTGEPGGLLSMGSHRVGHDWSDLASISCFELESWSEISSLPLLNSQWLKKFKVCVCHSLPFPFLSHLASHTPVLFLPTAHTQWTLRPQNSMCAGTVRRTCFLGISFYHPYLKISGTGCFSFLLDLIYTFFFGDKRKMTSDFFFLDIEVYFLPLLWFYMKIN